MRPSLIIDPATQEWVATYRPRCAHDHRALAFDLVGKVEANGWDPRLDPFAKLANARGRIGAVSLNHAPTPVHVDEWNEPGEATYLAVFREGHYVGGETVLTDYGISFDLRDGDMLAIPHGIRHHNEERSGGTYQRVVVAFVGRP